MVVEDRLDATNAGAQNGAGAIRVETEIGQSGIGPGFARGEQADLGEGIKPAKIALFEVIFCDVNTVV